MISDLLRSRLTDPAARFTAAAMVGVRHKGGNRDQKRDQIRISLRLACGLTPAQAAAAERRPVEAIEALLAQEGFRELVEADRELLAMPVEEQRARLVRLARIAIENALSDWDLGAACFVLKEEEQGRDPAVTVAEGVIARRRKPPAPLRPPPPPAPPKPLAAGYQPLLALVRRSEAGLRRAVIEEHAAQHAAVAAAPARGTAAAVPHALAMKQAAARQDPPIRPPAAAAATLPARPHRSSRRLRRPP
jgi:hypothetical protein